MIGDILHKVKCCRFWLQCKRKYKAFTTLLIDTKKSTVLEVPKTGAFRRSMFYRRHSETTLANNIVTILKQRLLMIRKRLKSLTN